MLIRSDTVGGNVRVLTIDRPEVRNALSMQALVELDAAVTDAEADRDIRCVVLTGAGDAFCAGNDIHELTRWTTDEQAIADVRRRGISWHVATADVPTIAAINGQCYGMGTIIAMSLDLRVGGPQTRIKVTAGSYGGANLTWNLPELVGWAHAKDILMTARVVEGADAYRMGMLNRFAAAGDVLDEALRLADAVAANPPDGVLRIKRLIHGGLGRDLEARAHAEHALEVDGILEGHADGIFSGFLAKSNERRAAKQPSSPH